METDKEVPKGLNEYIILACTWTVFPGEGQMPTAVQDIEKELSQSSCQHQDMSM